MKLMREPDRRQILTWIGSACLALLAASTEVAEGKSGGKGKGGGSKGGGGGSSGGNGGGNSSNAKARNAAKPPRNTAAGTVLDHNAALAAVKNGKALPLKALLPQIERKYGGEVIDAALRQTGRRLIYTLKMLSPEGRVFLIAVDAATGKPDGDVQLLGL